MIQSYNSALVNTIVADFQKGNQISAFEKLTKYLQDFPKDDIARYNFALMSEKLGHVDLALKNYKKVMNNNKDHWQSRFNLYLILINIKKYDDALELINQVLKIKKDYQPALRDKAVVLYYLNKPDEGLPFIKKSLDQNPKDYIAVNTLGLILMEMRKYNLAKKTFQEAINLNSKYFPSYNNLGRCFYIEYDRESALKNFKKALELNPNFTEAINNLANYYNETGFHKKAIELYEKALKLEPNKAEFLYNIGVAYHFLRDFKKAEKLYRDALKIVPNDDQLQKNIAMLLLATQRFEEGWKFFEGRIGLNEFRVKNSYIHNVRKKLWKGEKIKNEKRILVIKEQGVGDEILYASMYPDIIKDYKNLKIETEPRLISLFERSFQSKGTFIPFAKYSKNKEDLNNFDTILYAGSLGKIYRKKLSDFPKKNYLSVKKENFEIMKNKLDKINKKYKIGISWRSGNKSMKDYKSLDLSLLIPILKLEKFTYINLQYDYSFEELDSLNKKFNTNIITIKDIDAYNDFESMSALLMNLDLFITVSNTTAHLAGSLGLETWLMKPHNHAVFHYWNQPSNITPWYSKMKLFSFNPGWEKTVDEIKKKLIKQFK